MRITYNLTDNNMIVRTPAIEYSIGDRKIKAYDLISNRIEQSMPLKLEYAGELHVNAEFNIYGVEIDEITLVYMILTRSIFQAYLYIDENDKAYPFKQRLYLHLRSAISQKIKDEDDQKAITKDTDKKND